MMTSVKYADLGSPGAFANTIGWIDFSDLPSNLPINTTIKIANTLPNGYTLSFYITNNGITSINPQIIIPLSYPYGTTGYVGVLGQPIVSSNHIGTINDTITSSFVLSNITLQDLNGRNIDNFSIIAADAKVNISNSNYYTTTTEFITDNNSWTEIAMLPPILDNPIKGPLVNISGKIATITGSSESPLYTGAPVFSTLSPSKIITTFTTKFYNNNLFSHGVVFGIMIPQTTSCCLDVDISSNNTIIYVRPGRKQFFSIRPKKCCGIVSLYYLGNNYNSTGNYIEGTLGNYTLLPSGIFLDASCNLKDGDMDILSFQVSDSSCNPPFILNVAFTYSLCESC